MKSKCWILICTCVVGCAAQDAVNLSEVGGGGIGPSWAEFLQDPPMTWESFRDTAARESSAPYRFIVDGDIVLSDEQKLWDYYQAWLVQEYESRVTGGSALTVRNVMGADVLWPSSQKFNLTYCISNSFGSNKNRVIAAMGTATHSWSTRVSVGFTYRPDQDSACTSTNTNTVFNVNPVSDTFFAVSFFPDDVRANRQLLITSAAFTTTEGGRDFQGILRHETGHILGFRHEHIWITCTGETTADARHVTSYDVSSVMHYPQCRPGGSGGYRQTSSDFSGAISLYGNAQPLGCVPDGGIDDTLGVTSCCSGVAVHGSTVCSNPQDLTTCNQICGTALVNGCIPSGGWDDTLSSTSCCSGQAVSGSTWCLDPSDYGTDWVSCVQKCQ